VRIALSILGILASLTGAAPRELASRAWLIGTWHCSFTVGPKSGVYTTTWARALDDAWLTQTIDQPGIGGFHASYFVGYDARRRGWVRFGAMTTGQYFAIRMTDVGSGGWAWKYVSFFSKRSVTSRSVDALFKRVSDSRYTIDGPSYPANGVMLTEHHVCTKG
jgi:hypothetical protein